MLPQTVPLFFIEPIVRLLFRQVETDTPVLDWEALTRKRTYLTALTAVRWGVFPKYVPDCFFPKIAARGWEIGTHRAFE